MNRSLAMMCVLLALATGNARAHGGHAGAHPIGPARDAEGVSFGRAGDAKAVTRTVSVEMSDRGCALPLEIRVRRGDTARFVARNTGTQTHELVLGTSHELAQHAKQAERDPDLHPACGGGNHGRDRVAVHARRNIRIRMPDPRLDRVRDAWPDSGVALRAVRTLFNQPQGRDP